MVWQLHHESGSQILHRESCWGAWKFTELVRVVVGRGPIFHEAPIHGGGARAKEGKMEKGSPEIQGNKRSQKRPGEVEEEQCAKLAEDI